MKKFDPSLMLVESQIEYVGDTLRKLGLFVLNELKSVGALELEGIEYHNAFAEALKKGVELIKTNQLNEEQYLNIKNYYPLRRAISVLKNEHAKSYEKQKNPESNPKEGMLVFGKAVNVVMSEIKIVLEVFQFTNGSLNEVKKIIREGFGYNKLISEGDVDNIKKNQNSSKEGFWDEDLGKYVN